MELAQCACKSEKTHFVDKMQVKSHACLALQPLQMGWRCEYYAMQTSLEDH